MQSKEWPINSTFNQHVLSVYWVVVTKDTKINFKNSPCPREAYSPSAEKGKETDSEQYCNGNSE